MSHQLDSTDYLIEQANIDLDQEARAHARLTRDDELRIHLGDSWALIQAKLADGEAYVDARLDALCAQVQAQVQDGRDESEARMCRLAVRLEEMRIALESVERQIADYRAEKKALAAANS